MYKFALLGGARFDPVVGTFVENESIVVEDNEIVALDDLPAGYSGERIQCDDKYILPGLINLHEHFTFRATYGTPKKVLADDQNRQVIRSVRNAHLSLARGVTTVRELGARFWINNAVRQAIRDKVMVGPRVLSAGSPLARTGGHASFLSRECDGPIAFRTGVRELARHRTDWVKVMASDDPVEGFAPLHTTPDLRLDELREITTEASLRGLRVTAHVMGPQAIEWCIDAGLDTLEHGVHLTDALAVRMVERSMSLIPTISSYRRTIWEELGRGGEWARLHAPLIDPHSQSVETAIQHGVELGIGTDSAGEFVEECQILHELGLQATDCLRAATSHAAKILGMDATIGTIDVGKLADLVALRNNPLGDLANLRDVAFTVADGCLFEPVHFSASLQSAELPHQYY